MATTSLGTGPVRRGSAAFLPMLSIAALAAALAIPAAEAQQPAQRKGAQAAVPMPPAPVPSPQGVWIDHTGRGAVEITPCVPDAAPGTPQAQNLCGRIVWMKQPNDEKGQPLRDSLNKNAARRGQPICGLQIIGDVKPQPNGSWDNGWIYDPEQGSSFDLELQLRNPETLQVKGYMGVKFLSETFVWRRAKELPPKCDGV
ncbi:MAG TPA: DUF2147 domain-containing protein [Hyphomicrobiaceae bacterium]|nr:DUF2147 domain-containing protein [Hyphomicrobiaceae bacterium]